MTKKYQQLVIWQKAHQFVLSIYGLTKQLPKEELFSITSQLRRSAISVAANIVEGYRKRTRPDKMRFLNISQASLDETDYYLLLIQDLGYINTDTLRLFGDEVAKLLNAYISAIERDRQ